MKNGDLTFKESRAKILQTIAALESDIKKWRSHLQHLDDADRAIRTIANGVTAKRPPQRANAESGVLEGLGLTEAIKLLLGSQTGDSEAVNPVQVRDMLLEGGFTPNGKNFSVSVGTTLRRLAERGILNETQKGKKRFYSANMKKD